MNITLMKTFPANHHNIALNIKEDILRGLWKRWNGGRRGLTIEQAERDRRNIEKQLEELRILFRRMHFPELHNFLDAPFEELQRGVGLIVRRKQVESLSRAYELSRTIEQSVAQSGLVISEPLLRPAKEYYESQGKQNERELSTRNLIELAQRVKRDRKSLYHRLLHWLSLNGKATRELEDHLSREVHYRTQRALTDFFDQRILNRFVAHNGQSPNDFSLPDDSELRAELEEKYLAAETDAQATKALENEIQNKFSVVLRETLWPRIKTDLEFDYEVSQAVIEARGLIISSPHASDLQCLAEYFHVNPGHVKIIQWDKNETEFLMFGVVTSFHSIPAISNMILREEKRCREDEDRRFYARSVEDLFPPQYREQIGVTKEYGAEILAKAFLLTDALEVFRKKSSKLVVNYPQGRKTYLSFDNFTGEIAFEEEKFLHDGFWYQFANDRGCMLNAIDNLVAGRIGKSESAERFHAVKNLAGASLWDLALKKLLYQAKKVDSYY